MASRGRCRSRDGKAPLDPIGHRGGGAGTTTRHRANLHMVRLRPPMRWRRSLKTRWYTYLLFKMNRRKVQREIAPVSAYRAHRMSHVALRRRPNRTILHQIAALFAIICYLLNSHHSASHERQSSIIVKEGRGDPLKTKSDTHTYCSIYTQRITRSREAPSQHAAHR